MCQYMCISVTFIDGRFHGRSDGGRPEWPPSPLRLFQALVAANAQGLSCDSGIGRALEWLECQPPPMIVAPPAREGAPHCLSVPNNAMDIVAKAWSRGDYFGKKDNDPATHRTMKTVQPLVLNDGATIHYLYRLCGSSLANEDLMELVAQATSRIKALGWGIDLVVGKGSRVMAGGCQELKGECWTPTALSGTTMLRTPVAGTLKALRARHDSFLGRITKSGFRPVEPLTQFEVAAYRRTTDPLPRPSTAFQLRDASGAFCSYPQRRLIHIAGMVRHLAIEAMTQSPPADVDAEWVERYVAGHRDKTAKEHRQFSYLPLPSIGHPHADHAVRRVLVSAPAGDERFVMHLARRLEGRQLKPENGTEWGQDVPSLVRSDCDRVVRRYTEPAGRWASVTPVILPGHDDRKPAKTRKLIEAALAQSGIEQPCTFKWSAFSQFPHALSAHKYDRNRKPTGYIRPDHLLSQTAVHLTVEFGESRKVPGPLVIGAGRHCGFGLMAGGERS